MQKTIPDKIIEGSMIAVGIAEVAHLAALFLKQPFHVCATVMAVLYLCAAVFAVLWCLIKRKKQGKPQRENRFLKLMKVYPYLYLLIGLFIVLQIIWYFWMHTPYLKADITGEIVQTMLASDGIYTVNPMTGMSYKEGMPFRLQILALPTFYAAICRWTGIPVHLLVYSIIPSVTLLLSYCVYSRWAAYLFLQEGKKQAMFMLFTVMVYQFGCYAAAMDSFLLFFKGYGGAAYRAGVILPYALLCCLQGKWKSVVLCLLAEACVVWTLYGFGYTVLIVIVVLGMKLAVSLFERRKKV